MTERVDQVTDKKLALDVRELSKPYVRMLLVLGVLVRHTIVAIAFLFGVWLLERWIHFLWGDHRPLFFDAVPIKYAFDVMDLSVLAVFLVLALWEAVDTMRN